jgi:hypothetical protein
MFRRVWAKQRLPPMDMAARGGRLDIGDIAAVLSAVRPGNPGVRASPIAGRGLESPSHQVSARERTKQLTH